MTGVFILLVAFGVGLSLSDPHIETGINAEKTIVLNDDSDFLIELELGIDSEDIEEEEK